MIETKEAVVVNSSETQVEKVNSQPVLTGELQRVNVQLPKCPEKYCPQIQIQRLHSNSPEIDYLVDQYIAKYVKKVVQSFRLRDESSEILAEDATLNEKANLNLPKQQETTLKDFTPSQKLEKQLQTDINKFIDLSTEVQALGGTSQLTLYIKPQVLTAKGPHVTVVINASNYIGGAHGSTTQQYINFDLLENRPINLETMIKQGQRKQFNELVYTKFTAWLTDLQPETDLKSYEQLWNFNVSENFYLANKSLILQYGEYEIGPYAVGLPRLEIPYDELTTILMPKYLPEAVESEQLKAQNTPLDSKNTSSEK